MLNLQTMVFCKQLILLLRRTLNLKVASSQLTVGDLRHPYQHQITYRPQKPKYLISWGCILSHCTFWFIWSSVIVSCLPNIGLFKTHTHVFNVASNIHISSWNNNNATRIYKYFAPGVHHIIICWNEKENIFYIWFTPFVSYCPV